METFYNLNKQLKITGFQCEYVYHFCTHNKEVTVGHVLQVYGQNKTTILGTFTVTKIEKREGGYSWMGDSLEGTIDFLWPVINLTNYENCYVKC